MKKIFNPKKPLFWILLGIIVTAVVITILVINHFNVVEYDGALQETYPARVLNLYNIYIIK